MRILALIFLSAVIASCAPSLDKSLMNIEGYWEIASVRLPDGSSKDFSISQNIDYIEIHGYETGIRKKVQPDLSGNFKATDAIENIDIIHNNGVITFKYSTPFDSWTEEIIKANKNTLVIKNEDGNMYTYRRYKPLQLN